MGALGRSTVVEAVAGTPPADPADWVNITAENRTGFSDSTQKQERPRNDGSGRLAHDIIDHAEGDISMTLDDTDVSRPLFWSGGGTRMSFRYSPEGQASGKPFTVYQCLVSVPITFEAQGAVTYAVTGTIEVAPDTEGTY